MRISDFIDQSNQLDSPGDILALMESAANDLGFDRYAYCALTRHKQYSVGDQPAPAVALNYPTSWTDHYFEHAYQTRDPVVLRAPELDRPFLWDWLDNVFTLTRAQKTVMHEASEARLRNGVGVPLHGPRGDVCLVTFAAGDGHPDAAAQLPKLGVLSMQFHVAYRELSRNDINDRPVPILTDKERECLQWAVHGKTSGELSIILNISTSTVNFHIRNAFRKLDATNRISAVAKAIRYGLVSL